MHAPLAFGFAALVMSFSAASFAELGTRMPVSASEAAYVEKAFNRPWLSLAMGLLVVLTATISAATISVGTAGYLGVFVDLPAPLIIAMVVLSMGLVAGLSTRQSVTLVGMMTLIELGGLMLIIGGGFFGRSRFPDPPSRDPARIWRHRGLGRAFRDDPDRGVRVHRVRASDQCRRGNEEPVAHPAVGAFSDTRIDRTALRAGGQGGPCRGAA